MEPQQAITQFLHLPSDAQRIVAELIALLNRQTAAPSEAKVPAELQGAIMLPPLDVSGAPTTWPENPFVDPDFSGGWADRTDIVDSTEFVRELRRTQWGAGE